MASAADGVEWLSHTFLAARIRRLPHLFAPPPVPVGDWAGGHGGAPAGAGVTGAGAGGQGRAGAVVAEQDGDRAKEAAVREGLGVLVERALADLRGAGLVVCVGEDPKAGSATGLKAGARRVTGWTGKGGGGGGAAAQGLLDGQLKPTRLARIVSFYYLDLCTGAAMARGVRANATLGDVLRLAAGARVFDGLEVRAKWVLYIYIYIYHIYIHTYIHI